MLECYIYYVMVNPSHMFLIVQVHLIPAKWQNTVVPYFKELSIIFGKNREIGNMAENIDNMEAIQQSTHLDESTSKKIKAM